MMNYYTVSTKEALQAGRMNLKYIPLGILISGGVAIYVLMISGFFFEESFFSNTSKHIEKPWIFFGIPLAGLVASFAWRSFHSAAWKIWVLENVQDVHRVYQLAVSEGMIYKRGRWLNTLEYRTSDQNIRLEELEQRLDEPRQMEVAGSMGMAGEQEIPYSFKSVLLQSLLIVGMFAGLYVFTSGNATVPTPIYFIPVVFIGFLLVRWIPRFNNPAPIRFNNKELTLTDHPTLAWTSITDIRIESRQQGKSRTTYLVVESIGSGTIEFNVDEIQGSAAEIEDALYQYWALAKKQATNHS